MAQKIAETKEVMEKLNDARLHAVSCSETEVLSSTAQVVVPLVVKS